MLRRKHLLPILSAALLIILMGLFSVHTLTSIYQDIGRHITMGKLIWQTGSIPDTNLYSFTNRDFVYVNHHWLGGVLLYFGDRLVGLVGLIAVKAALIALAFGLALAAAWRPRIALPAVGLGLASIFTMVERTDVRPEVISFLFLGWFLFVLYRKPHSRLIWTLPLVQLVWVNTHIYFFMGPVVLLAWWIGEIGRSGRSALYGKRHWLLLTMVALATLCNPSGYHGAFYPLSIWSNYGYSIVENQTPFFLQAYHYPQMTTVAMFIVVILAVVSFIINRRHVRRNLDGIFLLLVTTGLAMSMIRNFPLVALCALPVALRNVDESGWRIRSRASLAVAVLIVALIGVSVVTNQIYDQAGIGGRQFGLTVPVGYQQSVGFFRAAGIKGPLFNNFDIGSFLIWKLPEEPVFIDGRPEAYPADFIQKVYIPMQEDADVWREQSEHYGINAIFWNYQDITPWSQLFVPRILKDPQWVLVYHGEGIMILVKNVPQNAAIIAKYRLQ
jgi:hypothetical protein